MGTHTHAPTKPPLTPHTYTHPKKPKNTHTVLSRFEAAPEAEHRFLRELLHLLYRDCVAHRPLLRALMARFLGAFARNPRRDAAVAPVLEVGSEGGSVGVGCFVGVCASPPALPLPSHMPTYIHTPRLSHTTQHNTKTQHKNTTHPTRCSARSSRGSPRP